MQDVYTIQAIATEQGAKVATDYIECLPRKVIHSDIDLMIGHLLADVGQINISYRYFESLLKKKPSDEEVAYVYHCFALNHRTEKEYRRALEIYKL